MPVWSIKFEVYHHVSGLSFIAEVYFWRPQKKLSFLVIYYYIYVCYYYEFIARNDDFWLAPESDSAMKLRLELKVTVDFKFDVLYK